jgi:hypothetical protein
MKNSRTHLESVGESYFQHMFHALSFTLALLLGSLCCLVHAFLPFAFEKKGSQIVTRLHGRMVIHRAELSSIPVEDVESTAGA